MQRNTRGFTAFICWPLQPENSELAHLPKTDAVTYLRTQAMARIVLADVPNIQASWVTMGMKVGQVALRFGANDFGSLMMEENVVSAAGTTNRTTLAEMRRLIADAGYQAKQRRQDYTILEGRRLVDDVLMSSGSERQATHRAGVRDRTRRGVTTSFKSLRTPAADQNGRPREKTARKKVSRSSSPARDCRGIAGVRGLADRSSCDRRAVRRRPLNGLDALLATVQVPPGRPRCDRRHSTTPKTRRTSRSAS